MNIFPENMAIVGNGPAQFNKNTGTFIDSFDKVLRMNNYVILKKYAIDYGTKTDYWCHCAWKDYAGAINMRNEKYEKVFIPTPINSYLWTSMQNHIIKDLVEIYIDTTTIIPVEYYTDLRNLMKDIEPTYDYRFSGPSTGLCISYWVYREQNNYLNPNNVFGFSFFKKDEPHEYFDKNKPIHISHNGNIEKKVFEYMFNEIS